MSGIFGGNTYTETRADRLNEFQLNQSSYGEFVPVIFGTTRVSPNVIDWADFQSHEHREEQTQGGKGGGKQTSVSITYTYTVKVVLALCEGPVSQIKKIWSNTDSYDNIANLGLTLFPGTLGQTPWPGLRFYGSGEEGAAHGTHWLPYSGLAYIAGEIDLGSSGSLPTINMEVKGLLADGGDGTDANPADVIAYIFSNAIGGVGMSAASLDSESLARYLTFCKAADILISTPPDTQNKKTYEIINDILSATNSIGIWSQNRLKIVPLSDETISANGVTYTPELAPKYNLTLDDLIPDSDGTTITFEREDSSETYNECSVEFLNRANSYEKQTVKYQVLTDVARRGVRAASTENIYLLHTKERAEYVAELKAKQSIYARNRYKFKLDWTKCLLEPGDLVTLTEPSLGLDKVVVRITQIDEDGEELDISAVGQDAGIFSASRYSGTDPTRPTIDTNVDPGSCQTPEMFLMPYQISSREMGLAVAGTKSDWGGCMVYVSFDGTQYSLIGEKWGNDRYGATLTVLSDEGNALEVKLKYAASQLQSASEASADANATLCLVGDEWITYQTAELLAPGRYKLSGLRRGLYGSAVADHAAEERFVRIDSVVFRHAFRAEDEGRLVYIKLPAFNMFGGNVQSLDEVPAYTYYINQAAPAPPMNLTAEGWFGSIILRWDIPPDPLFAAAEIYCGTEDDAGQAEYLCQSEGNQFSHHLGSFTGRYYWIRSVGINGKKSEWSSERGVWGKSEQGSHSAMVAAILQSNPYLQDELYDMQKGLAADIESLAETILSSDATLSAHTDDLKKGIAVAKEELGTRIEEGLLAEAFHRLELAAALNDANAAIRDERTARATADGAIASSVETLATAVGGNTAAIQESKQSIDGIKAKWGIKVDVNGKVAGLELIGTGQSSAMIFNVDTFIVGDANESPFVIAKVDGQWRVSIRNAYIQDAAISTLKIERGAVTTYVNFGSSQGSAIAINAGATSGYVNLPGALPLIIPDMIGGRPCSISWSNYYFDKESNCDCRILMSQSNNVYSATQIWASNVCSNTGQNGRYVSFSAQISFTPPADGTYYFWPQWRVLSGDPDCYPYSWMASWGATFLHMKR